MSADERGGLGWIGVGRMGLALVTRLLDAGHEVAVYNRTRSKAEPLAELGATIVDSPADLADRDVVFTMVAGSADVAEVIDGPRGAAKLLGLHPNTLRSRMKKLGITRPHHDGS